MRTDRPEYGIALVKCIVIEPLAHSPLKAEFPMIGETLFESDIPDMGRSFSYLQKIPPRPHAFPYYLGVDPAQYSSEA